MKRSRRCLAACLLLCLCAPAARAGSAADPHEQSFIAENDCAMTKMMNDMSLKPTGDIDRDFVAMMQPHHQGAIEMAEAELRYGHNEQLRRIAQEVIVDQQQEIVAMRAALGEPLPPPHAAPTQMPATPMPAMPMCMAKPHQ